MLLYVLGLAALPFATGFYSLAAVAMLLGLANGLGTGVVMILGADLARRSGEAGQFLGLWRVIGDFGTSIAPLLTGVLVNTASLAAASLMAAGLGLAGSLVMILLVTETLRSPERRAS
jgi:MFS family permease